MNTDNQISDYDKDFLSYSGLETYKAAESKLLKRDNILLRFNLLRQIANYAKTKIKYCGAEKIIKDLKYLENIKASTNCLIIGNGLSKNMLSVDGLERIRDDGWDIFGLNQYHKTPEIARHVNMFVCSDPDTLKKHPPGSILAKKTEGLVTTIQQYKPCIFYSHLYPKEYIRFYGCESYAFNDNYNPLSSNISPLHSRGYPSLTIFKAIAIALYMGYKSIQLIGLDNFAYTRNLWFLPGDEFLFLNDSADDQPRILLEKNMWKDTDHFLRSKLSEQMAFKKFALPNVHNLYPISSVPFIQKYYCFPEQFENLFTHDGKETLKNLYNLIANLPN